MIVKAAGADTAVSPSFAVERFTIHAERCLNRHYRGANCARCAESCPVAAIQVDRDNVQVDESTCVRCGVCVRSCPTELFVETGSPETGYGEEVRRSTKADVEIACPLAVVGGRREKTAVHSRIPESTCFIAPRCLGAISVANWLDLTQMGQRAVWVHDEPCETCRLAHAQQQIHAFVREANAWLGIVGQETAVFTTTENTVLLTESPKLKSAVVPVQQPAKRSFLRKVIGLEGVSSEAVMANGRLPQSRRHLLKLLHNTFPQMAVLHTAELPITNVTINESKCSACGMCARLCPMNALQFVTDEDELFGLFFQPGDCIDCGICANACPEKAIVFSDELEREAFWEKRPLRPIAGLLQLCDDCSTLISSLPAHTQCYICRQQSSRPNFLK